MLREGQVNLKREVTTAWKSTTHTNGQNMVSEEGRGGFADSLSPHDFPFLCFALSLMSSSFFSSPSLSQLNHFSYYLLRSGNEKRKKKETHQAAPPSRPLTTCTLV